MHHVKPTINAPHGKKKTGKGFSPNELKTAGVSKQEARKAGLPVDERRKSEHEENVATIKAHVKKA